jgi:hypothetical protein
MQFCLENRLLVITKPLSNFPVFFTKRVYPLRYHRVEG